MTRADKNSWVTAIKMYTTLLVVLIVFVIGFIIYLFKTPDGFTSNGTRLIVPIILIWLTYLIIRFNKYKIKLYREKLILDKRMQYVYKIIQHIYYGRKEIAITMFNDHIDINSSSGMFILGYMAAFDGKKIFDNGNITSESKDGEGQKD